MAKMTLLDIVSEILSDMTSDPVNSISDTFESQQVAKIVKRVFFNMHEERVWPHTGQLFRLTSSGDNTKPTHMRIEDDVASVEWVKYANVQDSGRVTYDAVRYMRPEDFIEYVMARNSDDPNVIVSIDYNGTPFFILNNHAPTYYTSFDDENLVFDSYEATIDSTLQHSKTQVFGYIEPAWQMLDNFVPDMPSKAFGMLVNEAKSTSFLKLKEVFSQKDEQAAVRQRSWLSREKRRMNPGTKYPNYGRPCPTVSKGRYKNDHFTG